MFCSKRLIPNVARRERFVTGGVTISNRQRRSVDFIAPKESDKIRRCRTPAGHDPRSRNFSSSSTTALKISSGLAACSLVGLVVESTLRGEEDSILLQEPTINTSGSAMTQTTSCDGGFFLRPKQSKLARSRTIKNMQDTSTKRSLRSRYDVQWRRPLGEGGFGAVYLAADKQTGEYVAVKKISKRFTDDSSFQHEMNSLLHIRQSGGHPNICSLRENFDEGDFFYLVIDLVRGGEMFDRLIEEGSYSEADAARLVQEVGSALLFLHGIGIVHADLKPENLMLSSENSSDAVIKLVDFGCSQLIDPKSPFFDADENHSNANTPGYSPPEVVDKSQRGKLLDPSVDMFSLGVIVYIMLTGVHPFDTDGTSSDAEINRRVLSKQNPPLRNSQITAHLSQSSIQLIEKLLEWNPKKRLTAEELLNHPWVRGETARRGKIADSDKRLKAFREYKTKLEASVFASMVHFSDEMAREDVAMKTSLIERSFQMLDQEHRGYITTKDLDLKLHGDNGQKQAHSGGDEGSQLSLSGFSSLLSENMKNRYFPAGHIIYREGERGHNMYFINAGRVEVSTNDGFKTITEQGDFFGEGALLNRQGRRNATIRCITPVHAIEISREYFEKYLSGGSETELSLKEKDRMRRRSRAKSILSLQRNLKEKTLTKGEILYAQGEPGENLYLVQEGVIDVTVGDSKVYAMQPGELLGEYALIFGRPRNSSAKCASDQCRVQCMSSADFHKLNRSNPSIKQSLREATLRRQFQKALVFATKKPFPTKKNELKEAFRAVDYNGSGTIDLSDAARALKNMDPTFTDRDVAEIIQSLDLDGNGKVSWDEFERIFGMSGTRYADRY